jgi:endonuclease/exonuclease/phosphatase family metal-dependent hydrolase/uncharacterized protein (UPF0248 family)
MRTSEQLYHRVRWDPRFDPARFVIGVNQRGAAAPKRIPLPSFVPGGDIPWHRVLFVEADGELIWDRASGVDRIDASDVGRVRDPRRLRAPFFTASTPYRWDPVAGWCPAAVAAPAAVPTAADLRVLTWNTLWDRFDSDRIDIARRRPLLLAALADADADVIALQEVEAGLLAMLLRAPWVRVGYTLSTDPAGKDIDDSGLLLLSRLPVREAARHVLGPHKAVIALTVRTAAGPLVVAATHLTSDHSDDGPARRRAELTRIAEGLAGVPGDLILLGDFNDGRDGGDGPAGTLGLRDAWSEVHGPDDRTPTFDPTVNPLAAVSSLSGRVSRLDRILLRPGAPRVTGATLRGDSPTPDGLYPSDHYGVQAELSFDGTGPLGVLEVAPTARTARGGELVLLGRRGDEPTRLRIALGTDEVWWPSETGRGEPARRDASRDERAHRTAQRVSAALPEGVVHVVGSRRMGCALPGADLDLVAALPGSVAMPEVQARVTAALAGATRVRQVTGARVPGLRLRVDDLDVDLAVVATGPLAPAEAVARRAKIGEAAATALSAISDADAVRTAPQVDHRSASPGWPGR